MRVAVQVTGGRGVGGMRTSFPTERQGQLQPRDPGDQDVSKGGGLGDIWSKPLPYRGENKAMEAKRASQDHAVNCGSPGIGFAGSSVWALPADHAGSRGS